MNKWIALVVTGSGILAAQIQTASPDVQADRTIIFRLRAPEAARVTLQFEGLRPMTKNEAGIWTATVGPVKPEIYQYNFIVDGVRILDPQNPDLRNGWAIDASLVEVPGSPPRIDELQTVPHGVLSIRTYYSTPLKKPRKLYVYTPPQYESKRRMRFPVMYLRHGAGDTEENWNSTGRAGVILDNLIAQRKAAPMILVMPNGDTDRSWAGANSPEGIELLSQEMLTDIIPMIDKAYRVGRGRENRAIAGVSMGGGQAFTIGLQHMDRFAWVGAFSSGLVSDSAVDLEKHVPGFFNRSAELNQKLKLLFLSCGTDDPRYAAQLAGAENLTSRGIRNVWVSTAGGQEWKAWRLALAEFALRVFQKGR